MHNMKLKVHLFLLYNLMLFILNVQEGVQLVLILSPVFLDILTRAGLGTACVFCVNLDMSAGYVIFFTQHTEGTKTGKTGE